MPIFNLTRRDRQCGGFGFESNRTVTWIRETRAPQGTYKGKPFYCFHHSFITDETRLYVLYGLLETKIIPKALIIAAVSRPRLDLSASELEYLVNQRVFMFEDDLNEIEAALEKYVSEAPK